MKNAHLSLVNAAVPVAATTIGWKEYISFPDWNIKPFKVKIDTGARTSALHVAACSLRETAEGTMADLGLAMDRRHPSRITIVSVPWLGTVRVRDTSGRSELRPLVEVLIRLGPVTKKIGLTLTNRSSMRFRMILGRKALEGDFLVDVGKKYLLCD